LKKYLYLAVVSLFLLLQFGCIQNGSNTEINTSIDLTEQTTIAAKLAQKSSDGKVATTKHATNITNISAPSIMGIKCIGNHDKITVAHTLETDQPKKVIYYGVDKVEITTNSGTHDLVDAFKTGTVTEEMILSFLVEEVKKGKGKSFMYKDGGSTAYTFDDYKVIKMRRVSGIRDIIFGKVEADINHLNGYYNQFTTTLPSSLTKPIDSELRS
jgi:hypothetical protein